MTVCASCGEDFQDERKQAICPRCATSHQVCASAGVAGATASAFPPTVVAESNHPDGSTEIATRSWDHRSTTVTSAVGDATHAYEGRPARGEQDVLEACESLMECLKSTGVEFVAKFRRPGGGETGIDAVADLANGETIEVQVVGVGDETLLRELGTSGQATSSKSPDELADDICERATVKSSKYSLEARQGRILLIDARRSPGHVTTAVRAALRDGERNRAIRSTAYGEVWLAGPTPGLTRRLDD